MVSMSGLYVLDKRPADIRFVHFRCNMNGRAVDKRVVSVPDLSLSFCFMLPIHEYDTANKCASLLTTPAVSSSGITTHVTMNLFVVSGTTAPPANPSGSGSSTACGSTGTATTTGHFLSPVMQHFMASKSTSTSTKR